jgi:BolA protein
MTGRERRIRSLLTARFAPEALEVKDDSALHAGHAGAAPSSELGGGETHFSVRIVAAAFAGLSRIERHRQVNQALAAELASGLHALAIVAKAPGES